MSAVPPTQEDQEQIEKFNRSLTSQEPYLPNFSPKETLMAWGFFLLMIFIIVGIPVLVYGFGWTVLGDTIKVVINSL